LPSRRRRTSKRVPYTTLFRSYCIHRNRVVEQGRWYDPKSCWFNWLYARVIPSHAAELTSAYLHRQVERILARQRLAHATLAQKRSEEHTSELQSRENLVCRLL